LPPDFTTGPLLDLPSASTPQKRFDRIAQLVRFGLPGTDMPGHEYLTDQQVASIRLWLLQNIAKPTPQSIASE